MDQKKSFTVAMKDFFGYKPGEGLAQFQAELKALTPDDRQYFYEGLKKVGVDCLPPMVLAK